MQGRVGELDQGEVGLDEHHDRTVAALRLADERVAELQAAERGAERQVASLRARIDALVGRSGAQGRRRVAHAKPQRHGTFRLDRQAGQGTSGLRGGAGRGAGLGGRRAGRRSFGAARSAVAALKEADGGRAAIVLGDWPADQRVGRGRMPDGARVGAGLSSAGAAARRDHGHALRCSGGRRPGRGAGAGGGPSRDCARSPPTATWWAPGWVSGGSDRKPSTLEITSEIEKARDELAAAEKQIAELTAALSGALSEQAAVRTPPSRRWPRSTNPTPRSRRSTNSWAGSVRNARAAEDEWRGLMRQREELEAGR